MRRLAAFLWLWMPGCATAADAIDWPADLPPLDYYAAAWDADLLNAERQPLAEYLRHVRSFYDGSLLAPGWRRAQADLLRGLSREERELLEPRLAELGRRLSAEWAKDNAVRRVDSQRLIAVSRRAREARSGGSLYAWLDEEVR